MIKTTTTLLAAALLSGSISSAAHADCSSPTFHQLPVISLGQKTADLAAGDVNGDGEVDLVTTGTESDAIEVRLGNGDGTFTTPLPYAVADAQDVVLADVNHDGALDVVASVEPGQSEQCVGFGSCSSLAVLLNDGDGAFATPAFTAIPFAASVVAIDTEDFDGDGFSDVMVAAPALTAGDPQLHVFFGTASGSFTRRTSWSVDGVVKDAIAARMHGPDAEPSVVVAAGPGDTSTWTRAMVYPSAGGTFANRTANTNLVQADRATHLVPADLNGDGKLDVAFSFYSATMNSMEMWGAAAMIGNGSGALSGPQSFTEGPSTELKDVAVGDVDEDGDNDVLVVAGGWKVFTRTATNFAIPNGSVPAGSTGVNASRTIALDYNHDGRMDFFFLDVAGSLSILEGACAARYSIVTLATSPNPSTLGQDVTATVTVAGRAEAPTPTGQVEITDSTGAIDVVAPLDGTGKATARLSNLAVKTYTFTARYPGDPEFASRSSAPVTHTVSLPPFGAPLNVVASGNAAANQVTIRWTATSNVASSDVLRRDSGNWTVIASGVTGESYVDVSVQSASAYVYAVRSHSTSGDLSAVSSPDVATTMNLSLPADLLIRASDVTTTRALANSLRRAAGLADAAFDDQLLVGVAVKAVHFTQLRAAIDEARTALGLSPISYSRPSLVPGSPVMRVDITELRGSFQ